MKKVFALLAAALVGAPTVMAQDESVRFGIKAAPNTAWLRPDTRGVESAGNRLGYTFGLMAEFPVGANGNYRFATGLFLNNAGGKVTVPYNYIAELNGPILTRALERDVSLRYVELPFTMKLMTNEIGYMRYFGQIGVSTGFNIRAKADMEEPIVDASTFYTLDFRTEPDVDIKDDVNLFRAALILGAGAEYNFSGSTALLFGITYNNGFINVFDGWEVPNDDGGTTRAKVFQDYLELSLGVLF